MAGEDKGGKVQALHPTLLNEEELSLYLDEFSFAFSDAEVTNIAISGPYGAGKLTHGSSLNLRRLELLKGTYSLGFTSHLQFLLGKMKTRALLERMKRMMSRKRSIGILRAN